MVAWKNLRKRGAELKHCGSSPLSPHSAPFPSNLRHFLGEQSCSRNSAKWQSWDPSGRRAPREPAGGGGCAPPGPECTRQVPAPPHRGDTTASTHPGRQLRTQLRAPEGDQESRRRSSWRRPARGKVGWIRAAEGSGESLLSDGFAHSLRSGDTRPSARWRSRSTRSAEDREVPGLAWVKSLVPTEHDPCVPGTGVAMRGRGGPQGSFTSRGGDAESRICHRSAPLRTLGGQSKSESDCAWRGRRSQSRARHLPRAWAAFARGVQQDPVELRPWTRGGRAAPGPSASRRCCCCCCSGRQRRGVGSWEQGRPGGTREGAGTWSCREPGSQSPPAVRGVGALGSAVRAGPGRGGGAATGRSDTCREPGSQGERRRCARVTHVRKRAVRLGSPRSRSGAVLLSRFWPPERGAGGVQQLGDTGECASPRRWDSSAAVARHAVLGGVREKLPSRLPGKSKFCQWELGGWGGAVSPGGKRRASCTLGDLETTSNS